MLRWDDNGDIPSKSGFQFFIWGWYTWIKAAIKCFSSSKHGDFPWQRTPAIVTIDVVVTGCVQKHWSI